MSENTFDIFMLAIALVCFILAAAGVNSPRVVLLAAGLAFWVTVPLVSAVNAR